MQAMNNLGNAYRNAGQNEAALQCFEKVLALIPNDSNMRAEEKEQSRNNLQQKIQKLKE
jgi:tetratricopeptide (TPR) repeat protein